jgi:hypothetical protein
MKSNRPDVLDFAVFGAELALWSATGLDSSGWTDILNVRPGSPDADAAHKAEVARLARESEIGRVALDRYMESRDVVGDEITNEWVLMSDPLSQDPVAFSLMATPHDGDRK